MQDQPVGFVCPYCHTTAPPFVCSKVSTGGWIIFALLLLSCIGTLFCWVGLFFTDTYHQCRQCGIRLG